MPDEISCTFCEKSRVQVQKLIAAENAVICDECLDVSVQILLDEGFELRAIAGYLLKRVELQLKRIELKPIANQVKIAERPDHCFYLGPFAEPFNTIYRSHVIPVLKTEGISVERADEVYSSEVIIEDVWAGISAAAFVVADTTGRNPSVMYGIGIAHTLGKPVLIASQSIDDVPFDLRHRRCIIYDYTTPGCNRLQQGLRDTAKYILGREMEEDAEA